MLIAAVSAARPKSPIILYSLCQTGRGLVGPQKSFVMRTYRGNEGAHEGVGWAPVLRHVERTRVLVHMLDVSGMTERDLGGFQGNQPRMGLYSRNFPGFPQTVVAE